jgi:hypothetical protein
VDIQVERLLRMRLPGEKQIHRVNEAIGSLRFLSPEIAMLMEADYNLKQFRSSQNGR